MPFDKKERKKQFGVRSSKSRNIITDEWAVLAGVSNGGYGGCFAVKGAGRNHLQVLPETHSFYTS